MLKKVGETIASDFMTKKTNPDNKSYLIETQPPSPSIIDKDSNDIVEKKTEQDKEEEEDENEEE